MKIKTLRKVVKGENPIIQITYTNWLGLLKVRDICMLNYADYWIFMDNSRIILDCQAINVFYRNNEDYFTLNK